MSKYKIALVGLGSIGKRHIVNISAVLKKRNIEFSIDVIRRKSSVPIDDDITDKIACVYYENDTIPEDYDVVFITNPTCLHFETVKKFMNKSKNMFIEKPIFDTHKIEITDLSLKPNGVYYVASPLRYSEVIQYLKKNLSDYKVYSVRAICSSYLPDWRPNVDYRNTYSAHQDQGGGVSIDLIHEWDYMMYLFGKPKKVHNFRGKYSNLDINSDDISIYIAEYEQMLLEIHLDYFGRKSIRELLIISENETIVADILNSEVRFLKENRSIQFFEERNGYQLREMEYFFDLIEGKSKNDNDITTALMTLKIAKEGNL